LGVDALLNPFVFTGWEIALDLNLVVVGDYCTSENIVGWNSSLFGEMGNTFLSGLAGADRD